MKQRLIQLKQWITRHPYRASLIAVWGIVGIILPYYIAHAQDAAGVGSKISLVLGWIIYTLLIMPLGWIMLLLVMVLVGVLKYNNFINEPIVTIGWTIVRDFMNLAFVVALMIIAFATVFKVQAYHYKQMLPKLVIAAVVVNFSKMITGILIDVAQVAMLTFVNAFDKLAAGNLTAAFGVYDLLALPAKSDLGSDSTWYGVLGAFVLGAILLLVADAVLLVMIVVVVVRIVYLWMLAILSPMAWVAPIIPGGQKYASQWWEKLSQQLVTGVVMAFFLWLTFAAMQINDQIASAPPISNLQKDQASGVAGAPTASGDVSQHAFVASKAGTYESMFGFIIAIAMLMGSLMVAQQMGGAAGSLAGNITSNFQRAGMGAMKWAGGKAAKWSGARNLYDTAKGYMEGRKLRDELGRGKYQGLGKDIAETGFIRGTLASFNRKVNPVSYFRQEAAKKRANELEKTLERKRLEHKFISGQGTEEEREALRSQIVNASHGMDHLHEDKNNWVKLNQKVTRGGTLSDTEQANYDALKKKYNAIDQDADLSQVTAWKDEKDKITAQAQNTMQQLYSTQWTDAEKKRFQGAFSSGNISVGQNKDGSLSFGSKYAASTALSSLLTPQLSGLQEHSRGHFYRKELDRLNEDKIYVEKGGMSYSTAKQQSEQKQVEIERLQGNIQKNQTLGYDQATRAADRAEYQRLSLKRTRNTAEQERLEALKKKYGTKDGQTINEGEVWKNIEKDEEQLSKVKHEKDLVDFYIAARDNGGQITQQMRDDFNSGKEASQQLNAGVSTGEALLNAAASLKLTPEMKENELAHVQESINDAQFKLDIALKPVSEEGRQKLEKEITNLQKEYFAKTTQVQKRAMPVWSEFYRRQWRRQQSSEEEKKIETEDSDELRALYLDADKRMKGPVTEDVKRQMKFRKMAILRKLTNNGDLNDILNEYGYDSDFEGFKKFMDKLQEDTGMDPQEKQLLALDLSYLARKNGHFDYTFVNKYDKKEGKFRWNDHKEHVDRAVSELIKSPSARTIAQHGRLALGYEKADGAYRLHDVGKLLLQYYYKDYVRLMDRAEMNRSQLEKIYEAMPQINDELPAEMLQARTPYFGKTFEQTLNERAATKDSRDIKKMLQELIKRQQAQPGRWT